MRDSPHAPLIGKYVLQRMNASSYIMFKPMAPDVFDAKYIPLRIANLSCEGTAEKTNNNWILISGSTPQYSIINTSEHPNWMGSNDNNDDE